MSAEWSAEDEQTLRSLWGTAMSAAKIGELMGRGRNSIIGKAHRLKLPPILGRGPGRSATRNPKGPRKIRLRVVNQAAPQPKPKPVIVKRVAAEEPASLDLTLTQMDAFQCHWATNDGGPFLFCGAVTDGHATYCPHHLARSVVEPVPRAKPSRWFGWRSAA